MFAASVVNQFHLPWWERLVARFDRVVFLPHWKFFAPNPAFAGVHLIYRDRAGAGLSEWAEILLPSTGPWRWVWNPARYERKALQDLYRGLLRSRITFGIEDLELIELTNPYVILLAWVTAQPDAMASATHRRFAIVQSIGHGPGRTVRPVFASREHPLDRG